jgi:putative tricarboxylic transport membrane protein
MGAFMSDNTIFSVVIMIIFAILGYIMKKLDFSFVTFIIGFVLGPMLELSLQQAMGISGNNLWILVQRPVSFGFLILTGIIIWRIWKSKKKMV